MAAAKATLTLNSFPKGHLDNLDKRELFGTIAIDASPATYTTNGVPLVNGAVGVYDTGTPFWGMVQGVSGFEYQYDPVNNTVRIYQQDGTTGALTEIGNGVAIPAGVSGDTIQARFTVLRSV